MSITFVLRNDFSDDADYVFGDPNDDDFRYVGGLCVVGVEDRFGIPRKTRAIEVTLHRVTTEPLQKMEGFVKIMYSGEYVYFSDFVGGRELITRSARKSLAKLGVGDGAYYVRIVTKEIQK